MGLGAIIIRIAAIAGAAALAAPAVAQSAAPAANPPAAAPAAPPSGTVCTGCIPRLTVVELVLDADLGSKISVTGAIFPLHLARPIVIDGAEVLPAGAAGQGEVIHAKKAGGAGAAGELVLAARFVTVGGRALRLRSMRLALAGKDATGAVDAYNAAAAGAAAFAPLPLGVLGFAITGRNIVLPAGTRALAKTAEDFPIAPPPPGAAASASSTDGH